jgi:hypothetical protein
MRTNIKGTGVRMILTPLYARRLGLDKAIRCSGLRFHLIPVPADNLATSMGNITTEQDRTIKNIELWNNGHWIALADENEYVVAMPQFLYDRNILTSQIYPQYVIGETTMVGDVRSLLLQLFEEDERFVFPEEIDTVNFSTMGCPSWNIFLPL